MSIIHAKTDPNESIRERENREIVRHIAAEGMVLLENKGVLPLSKETRTIAIYGAGARRTIKGGIGSGDVNVRSYVTVEQGLEHAGYQITTKAYLDRYDQLVASANEAYFTDAMAKIAAGGDVVKVLIEHPFQEPEAPLLTEQDMEDTEADLAIFVLSRNSGEGADRNPVPGDYYLSAIESANLTLLGRHYSNVIVLLNVGGAVDTTALNAIEGIGAVLLMSQAGSATGDTVADILTGKVTPSGKLAMTWAASYEDYPYASEFGRQDEDLDDSWYREGIYTGYRYFDTFDVTPAYPFGFGSSYTDFSLEPLRLEIKADQVRLGVRVTNTGTKHSGREVVQVYVSAPDGSLEKPYQELKGYGKTCLLSPGESEKLTVSFPLSSLASYSERQAAWIMEPGEYFVRMGNSSRNTHIVGVLTLSHMVIVSQLKNLFRDPQPMETLSKADTKPYSYPEETLEKAQTLRIPILAEAIRSETIQYRNAPVLLHEPERLWTVSDVKTGLCTLDDLVACMTPEEMARLCIGNGTESMLGGSVIGAAALAVPGAAGETTSRLYEKYGIINMVLSDGPAGLRLSPEFEMDKAGKIVQSENPIQILFAGQKTPIEKPEHTTKYYQYCTAIPIATLLAQTWDPEQLYTAGVLVGGEMTEFGVTLWLAPGMNIQRNPLCGRNFEYYSEDPLVSGICASAITNGVQSHPGVGTAIKHFAGNNQEDNRYNCNSHISERALREIYLKGFEIAVRTSQPMTMMTAYNLLNGVHAANSHDLLTAVARDEWGFAGFIMTDWGTTGLSLPGVQKKEHLYPDAAPSGCISGGNDLIMPGSEHDREDILAKLDDPTVTDFPVTKAQLQRAAKNILRVLLAGNCYENSQPWAIAQELGSWLSVTHETF